MLKKLKQHRRLIVILFGALVVITAFYWSPAKRKARQADSIYQELQHPSWSKRVDRKFGTMPSGGSSDIPNIYLVDVREVSIPITEAIEYYDKVTDNLKLRECHVDSYEDAKQKFDREWLMFGVNVPDRQNTLVITQRFSAESTLRRE